MKTELSDSGGEEAKLYYSSREENDSIFPEKEAEDDYIFSEGETEESFSKLFGVKPLCRNDLEFYNEDEYKNYILKDINEIRRQNNIPEIDLNQRFALLREKDFLNEYKTMYYNRDQKRLLDQKYLVAYDFMMRDIPSDPTDPNNKFVKFFKDPNQIVAEMREEKKKLLEKVIEEEDTEKDNM